MTEQSEMTIGSRGTRYWKLPNGKFHRVSGPAIVCVNGHKEWWVNGNKHREDGPAIEWGNGSKEWWIGGKFIYSEE